MKKLALIVMITFLIFFFSIALFSQEEQKYTNDSFARLCAIEGKGTVQKGPDLGLEECVINMPIEEGDRLATTEGRADIYIGKNNYVRLDNSTKLEFLNLPTKNTDLIRLRVLTGNIYLSVNRLEREKSIEIHSADASFYILDEGLYRIDVRENTRTEIFVFKGVVEVAGEGGSMLLKSEQTLAIVGGRFDSKPKRFFAVAEDAFDRWDESRESLIRTAVAGRYLPEEIQDFESELEENGDWIYLQPYGWVWVPSGVGDGWRPYYNGSWYWLSMGGWSWIPYEPWGWATCHYGRWHWGIGLGWYWIPDPFWGPAWVSWYWGPYYYAWAPLSWWGYPGIVIDGWYYGHGYGQYYPHSSRALTVIHKDQLKARDVPSVALKSDVLKDIKNLSFSNEQPAVRPAGGKLMPWEMAGDKALVRKESAAQTATSERGLQPGSSKNAESAVPSKREGTGQVQAPAPQERRIRKLDSSQSGVRKGSFGYPSSPGISIGKNSGSRFSGFRSLRNSFYKYIQGDRSSGRTTSSRGSISKGTSSSSRSKGSISSGSRSSSSGARSSGSRSSGSIKKKN